MNRTTRDYCARNRHPKWRWWAARYDMSTWRWVWFGNFCVNCGALVSDTQAKKPPRMSAAVLALQDAIIQKREQLRKRKSPPNPISSPDRGNT